MAGTTMAGTTAGLADESALEPDVPLWRNWRYQSLAAGSFSAYTGVSIADVVYPLLILGFTGSPMLASVFGLLQFLAMILCSLPAGSFIDRHDRRKILIVNDSVRAVAGASLALTLASGHVWLVQLYLVAVVLGGCQAFAGARMIAVRAVVPERQLTRALSQQQVRTAVATLIGPAIGAALYAVSRSLPFVASAVGLALSAFTAVLARFDGRPEPQPEPAGAADERSGDGALAGLRTLWAQPLMRAAMLLIMIVNLIAVPMDLVLIVQARHEGVPTHYIGLVLAAFAGGAVLGGPLIPLLHRLVRPGWLLIGFVSLFTCVLPLLAIPLGGFWMAGCIAVVGMALPALDVLIQVLIFQQVPDNQRGRVVSAAMMLMSLGMPLGSALGGLLLQVFTPTTALLAFAVVTGASALYALSQRSLRSAAWPQP